MILIVVLAALALGVFVGAAFAWTWPCHCPRCTTHRSVEWGEAREAMRRASGHHIEDRA